MKKRILSVLAAAAAVAVLAPLTVTTSAAEMNCRIPFSFVVNGATLPPGLYTFSTQSSALLVRGFNKGAVVLTNGLYSRDENRKAVFEKTGDRYVLREVWLSGGSGREIPRPRWDGDRKIASTLPVERVVIRGM